MRFILNHLRSLSVIFWYSVALQAHGHVIDEHEYANGKQQVL